MNYSDILKICKRYAHRVVLRAGSYRAVRAGAALFLVVLLFWGVFVCRRPVIVVSDKPFNLLYGENRALLQRLSLSVRLFRPVRVANIAGGAGPDLAAQAAAALSRRPYGVFFPYRYREGARRYKKDRPGFPVFILAGRMEQDQAALSGDLEPLWFFTDTATDLYRAGVLAGFLASGAQAPVALYGEGLKKDKIAAFTHGLEENWPEAPFFPPFSADMAKPGCVVVLGKVDSYQYEWAESPLLLFSWTDPALAPRHTLALFDDSPWAQLGPALELIRKGKPGGLISSKIELPEQQGELKRENFDISRWKVLRYEARNTDN